MSKQLIAAIRSRRVKRLFTDDPIPRETLETIVEMARWAPSASNRRLQKFIVVEDGRRIRQIRALSPGMWGYPTALVVICNDWQKTRAQGLEEGDCGVYIDVGTAGQNMLLAAHVLGVGAGPVTSFSKAAVQEFLDLPSWLAPVMIICLGIPMTEPQSDRIRPPRTLHWTELAYWERYAPKEAPSPT